MNKKIKKWTITAATAALLTAGGYQVAKFDENRGYGVVDTTQTVIYDTIVNYDTVKTVIEIRDTVWFNDSLKLVEFSKLGSIRLGNSKIKLCNIREEVK